MRLIIIRTVLALALPATPAFASQFPVEGNVPPTCSVNGSLPTLDFSGLINTTTGATQTVASVSRTLPVNCNGANTSVTVRRGNLVAQNIATVSAPFSKTFVIGSVSVSTGTRTVTDSSSVGAGNLSAGTSSTVGTPFGPFTALTVTANPGTQSGTLVASTQYIGTIVIDLTSQN